MLGAYRLARAAPALACLLVSLQACSLLGSHDPESVAKGISAAIAPQPDLFAVTAMRQYRVGPGDELQVILKGTQAALGNAVVTVDGHASLPRKGDTQVENMTLDEIAAFIEKDHGGGVAVTLRAPAAVYVVGTVAQPGPIAYREGLTLGALLTLTGGATHKADLRTVFIKPRRADAERSAAFDPALPILPGDVVRLQERYF